MELNLFYHNSRKKTRGYKKTQTEQKNLNLFEKICKKT